MKTELWKKLGLTGVRGPEIPFCLGHTFVKVTELEELLQKYQRVYGYREGKQWSQVQAVDDTHTGLVICVEEIVKEPCKHENVVSNIERYGRHFYHCLQCNKNVFPSAYEEIKEHSRG